MKLVVILCAVITVVPALKQEPYKLQPERLLAAVNNFGKPCVKSENVDVNVLVAQVAEASLPRDDVHNEFLYCFGVKGGFVLEDGHINVDRLAGLLGDHPLREAMKESLTKCNEVTKENHIETVVAMNNCVSDTAPIRFVFA